MAIINATPDSFSDGGKFFSKNKAIERGLEAIEQGADIIDVGGESTRPGANPVDAAEEIRRSVPVVEEIRKAAPDAVISIDTMKSEVAQTALDAGATIVNDVSGLNNNPEIAEIAARANAGLILMHMRGKPRTMQKNPQYDDVVRDIFGFLQSAIEKARAAGVEEIYADVGIGFGKSVEHNLELLANYEYFSKLGVPTVLGVSRKSFIGKILGIEDPEERDVATALIHALLIDGGAAIARVHNVSALATTKKLFEAIFSKKTQ